MKRSSYSPGTNRSHSQITTLNSTNDANDTNNSTKRNKIDDSDNPTTSKSHHSYNTFSHLSGSSKVKDPLPKMTKSMWDYFCKNMQSAECFHKKLELKEALSQMFKDIFPYLGVFIVGSSANGFGSNLSDVDICLMVSHEEINQKTEAICVLKIIARALRKASFIKELNVIAAKVPIIKFRDTHNLIDCDININNHIGIRNTHLLKAYSDIDWRAKPLILCIKHWAQYHDINDASRQTLSSYSLALMGIYYMQTLNPPVLPVLQEMRPDKFDVKIDIRTLRLNDDAAIWTSANSQTLGELFAGFLEFYSNFDFESKVISVRTGSIIPKSALPSQALETQYTQWKFILIEEPFDLSNTARAVYDYSVFREIVDVFKESNKMIKKTKSFDQLFTEKFFNIDRHSFSNYYDGKRF